MVDRIVWIAVVREKKPGDAFELSRRSDNLSDVG